MGQSGDAGDRRQELLSRSSRASMRSFLLYGDYERAGAARPAGSVGFVGLGLLFALRARASQVLVSVSRRVARGGGCRICRGAVTNSSIPSCDPAPEAADDEAADLDDEGEPAL